MDDFLKDEPTTVEPVAEAPQELEAQDTGEQAPAPPAEPQREDPEEGKRKGLEAALIAERRRRQQLEEQFAQLQQQAQPKQSENGPPDPNSYQDNPQAYWEAVAEYKAEQVLERKIQESRKQAQLQAHRREMEERDRRMNDVVTNGQLKYADFDPVINTGLGPFLTPELGNKLADADAGHDLAYWLGKNPGEAARVSKLTGDALVRALTRIEYQITAQPKPSIPATLTTTRDARGQFAGVQTGPTTLHDILGIKPD